MVKIHNGKWCMYVDFTDLNKACPKDSYLLPSIDCLVDSAFGYEKLSFMDVYSGYNQILIHPSDQSKTAFITEYGNYSYKVMPFGLKNAGATYQRLMDKVFTQQIGRNIEVYVDDMVSKTKLGDSHLDDLEEIFHQIREYIMRLNPEKCAFGVQSGKFLDFMLTNRGIEANPEKCKAVLDMMSPKTIKEVQQLTGRLVALSRFLPCLASKSFYGSSNSQGCGSGIILEDGNGNVIEQSLHFSFKASNNQSEYEALIVGLKLATDLSIAKLKVYYDSLLIVQQVNDLYQVKDPLLSKYLAIVQNLLFKFSKCEIQHIPRESNSRADILSKLANTQMTKSSFYQSTLLKPSIDLTEILSVTQDTDWRTTYINYLRTGVLPADIDNPRHFRRQESFFTIHDNSLYRRGFSRPLLKCLSKSETKLAMTEAHEEICGTHLGARSISLKILRAGFFWPTLQQDCKTKVRSCYNFQKHSPITHLPAELLHSSEDLKVKHFSSVEHPQTNGLAEAANKVILHALRKKLDDAKGLWAALILEIILGNNTTVHSTTKETHFRLVYGSDAMIPVEISQTSLCTQLADHSTSNTV
ncbi:uncharacterized protein [Arachis hypogaea]|uniref:uncharacterized protein n=1 Tax=Arachis hypogaea TaxID=3818 RepID=UPI003B21C5BF